MEIFGRPELASLVFAHVARRADLARLAAASRQLYAALQPLVFAELHVAADALPAAALASPWAREYTRTLVVHPHRREAAASLTRLFARAAPLDGIRTVSLRISADLLGDSDDDDDDGESAAAQLHELVGALLRHVARRATVLQLVCEDFDTTASIKHTPLLLGANSPAVTALRRIARDFGGGLPLREARLAGGWTLDFACPATGAEDSLPRVLHALHAGSGLAMGLAADDAPKNGAAAVFVAVPESVPVLEQCLRSGLVPRHVVVEAVTERAVGGSFWAHALWRSDAAPVASLAVRGLPDFAEAFAGQILPHLREWPHLRALRLSCLGTGAPGEHAAACGLVRAALPKLHTLEISLH